MEVKMAKLYPSWIIFIYVLIGKNISIMQLTTYYQDQFHIIIQFCLTVED